MESFYLENVSRYRSLVQALDPCPKPRLSEGSPSSTMIVGVRIRPLAEDEEFPSAVFPRSIQKSVVDIHDLYNHPSGIPRLRSTDYQVDRLFDSDSTTEQIYKDLVADLIPFAWHGGIGTLFAYGQTGSGKTFTVSGLEELVVETLMSGTLDGEKQVYVTIIDLAGNAAFDLLDERKPISLLDDADGVTQLKGAEEHAVHNVEDVRALLERATSFRQTAPTLKNPASSRSHAICRIRIRDISSGSGGLLYLVDLAGSEGARDVVAHGADRMRETQQINISLSVLKDCIRGKAQADAAALSGDGNAGQKLPRMPFRQSAITRILKHVFDPASTRPCKTVVIACVNPSLADVASSKNTLRFAEMLRVQVLTPDEDAATAIHWTNAQVRSWIKQNCGSPPILDSIVAPRETGAQMFKLSSTEIEYRCRRCPKVKAEQARAFRSKLWDMYISH